MSTIFSIAPWGMTASVRLQSVAPTEHHVGQPGPVACTVDSLMATTLLRAAIRTLEVADPLNHAVLSVETQGRASG